MPTVLKEIPTWLCIALNEIGQAEVEGKAANPRILDYLKTVGVTSSSDEVPSCSAFVNFCLIESGLEGTKSALARSFLSYGISLQKATLGCIVVFKRGEPWQGHVGFLLDEHQGLVRLVGGNQLNRVGVNNYKKADVLSYRWPDIPA